MVREISDRFSMVFDHPFFCAIRDSTTDEILFAAAVVDPEE
jgi:serine protease inhibitor